MTTTLRKTIKKRPGLAGITAALLLSVAGTMVYNTTDAQAENPEAAEAYVPQVDVVTVEPQALRVWSNFSGRLAAVDTVQVRPRVGGTITEILFKDGQLVEKGAPLYVIDPRPFEAEVASAKADLESARSQAALAKQELDRAKKLVANKHISESALDARKNTYRVSNASINAAKAALIQAELDLEYAHIQAPVSGRISRAEITEGNVIEAGANAPVLTTIVSNDKLFAEFDVDEQTYINTVRNMAAGEMPVELRLSSSSDVVYEGIIDSFDNRLDTTSGTIRARAIFDNADGALLPGMYADVRMGSAGKEKLMIVPERAVGTDQDKKYVYVISPEQTVEYREVRLGRTLDGKRIISSGLQAGEQVMVNSLQRVMPGMGVQPVDIATQKGNEDPTGLGELAQNPETAEK